MEPMTLLTGVIAAATAGAAWGAFVAARATKKAAEAEVFSNLVADYFGEEMAADLLALSEWYADAAERDPSKAIAASAARYASSGNERTFEGLYEARRRVLGWYRRASNLLNAGLLTAELAREVRGWAGKELLLNVVIPLTTARGTWGEFGGTDMENFADVFGRAFAVGPAAVDVVTSVRSKVVELGGPAYPMPGTVSSLPAAQGGQVRAVAGGKAGT